MKYTVYKITNLINNKIYIGVHKTNNLEDGYMGSGKHLKYAQNKYGIENFEKEILQVFDNSEDMFNMESELVNEDFVKDRETYNIKIGGFGGFDHINDGSEEFLKRQKEFNTRGNLVLKELCKNKNSNWYKNRSRKISKANVIRLEAGGLDGFIEAGSTSFLGKSHSEETKKKIGEANSKHQKGEGNSQFGTMWIHNLEEKKSKKIKKDEFPTWEQDGWLKGRKMKF